MATPFFVPLPLRIGNGTITILKTNKVMKKSKNNKGSSGQFRKVEVSKLSDASSQKNISGTDEKKVEKNFFKKWFRWDRLAAIATILTLIITLYGLIPRDPVDIIKERIIENIVKVENTLNPIQLLAENDSSEYLHILGNMQQSTLDYCTLWKSLENAEPYAKYAELPIPELVNVLQRDFERMNQINESASRIIECIRDIQTFEALTDNLYLTKISHAKQNDILNSVNAKNVIDSVYRKRCLEFIVEAQNDRNRNKEYKKNLRKGLEQLDKLKGEADHYKMDDALLDYVLE